MWNSKYLNRQGPPEKDKEESTYHSKDDTRPVYVGKKMKVSERGIDHCLQKGGVWARKNSLTIINTKRKKTDLKDPPSKTLVWGTSKPCHEKIPGVKQMRTAIRGTKQTSAKGLTRQVNIGRVNRWNRITGRGIRPRGEENGPTSWGGLKKIKVPRNYGMT